MQDYEASRRLLAPDEIRRADRYRFEPPRRTYVTCRAALRCLLASYLGVEPAELRFRYGRQGKPELDGNATGLEFNLSHSEEWGLIAVTRIGRAGIDVERCRTLQDMDAMADVCFSAFEMEAYRAATDRAEAFYDTWTRKEAFVKAVGSGLTLPLKSFSVTLQEPTKLVEAVELDPERWSLAGLNVAAGYAAAIAIEAATVHIEPYDFVV
jgi:4'-phosphopantetheinyl transferase